MDVLAAMRDIQDQLTEAGLRATLDPRDLNPPAVLLRPPVLHYRFGRGCIQADWTVRLYLPDPGTGNALREALPLLTDIQDALNYAAVQAVPSDFAMLDGSTLPGYSLTWSTR